METNTIIKFIEKKHLIGQLETAELKTVIDEFPYFQSARVLYLKGLKNQHSFKYNNELKITAAYTADRTVLFDLISSEEFNKDQKEEIKQETAATILEENSVEKIMQKEEIEPETVSEAMALNEEKLEIGAPIPFTESENFSFNQWLQLSTKTPIIRDGSAIKEVDKNQSIIERFIENNPKIAPLSKDKNVSVLVAQNKQDSSLMTETLAKVYLEQKKYENAIQAYRILSLKYPEKSGFFADQIKRIQILQKNKS
ncbi:hypothetical protein [Polaribacter glomeratus]|uniref:Tetratricopeptide repeat protein n=1 Tax=Polaribacter glomeratus TaxID=102 RepID=A0A2S7WZ51_9FLAO|nr:hypothetical protein [Polaribacter glomeratus]PQJ82843.1 hypothetical protein BTO16_09755 [Polaribacter glomeratus]TXD65386.1 hypothetical protein ESX12_11235 [Polaribacter glomeratus]